MYSFDLNDNRFSKETQHDYSGPVAQMLADETVSYAYDGNGRLLQETLDAAGTADDRTTAYHYGTSYDRTEQTGKTVHDGLTTAGTVLEEVTRAHDLAGRQVSAEVDKTSSASSVSTVYPMTSLNLRDYPLRSDLCFSRREGARSPIRR